MSPIQSKAKFLIIALLFAIGVVYFLVNHSDFIQALEKQSLEYLYKFRGEKPFSSHIELIYIDEKTIEQIGRPPYSAEILQEILTGIDRLGARVIGVEVDNFQNQSISRPINIKAGLVWGLSKSCTGTLADVDSKNEETRHQFPCNWQEFRGIQDTLNCNFAHLRIDPDNYRIARYRVPLFLKKCDILLPAFTFSILKKYFQVEDKRIENLSDKIVLNFKSMPALEIPLSKGTSIPVTYYASQGTAEHSHSFIDILNAVRTLPHGPTDMAHLSIFLDKVVILGSQLKNFGYQTPFASNINGFFLQATLLSDLMQNKFIREAGQSPKLIVYLSIFLLLSVMTLTTNSIWRLGGFGFLLVCLIVFQIFYFLIWGIFIQLWSLLIFSFLVFGAFLVLENFSTAKTTVKKTSGNSLSMPLNVNFSTIFTEPFVRVVILLSKGKKNLNLTHTLETEQDCKSGLSAFHRSPQNKTPYTFPVSKLNRICAETNRLGEIYYNYYQNKQSEMMKPIELLRRIGEKIYHEFGLSKTFNEIFELQRNPLYLNMVIDDPTIPWQWAYDSRQDAFLCDRFPLSFSFAIEKANLKNFEVQPEPEMPLFNQLGALLLHGNWRGHPTRELSQVDQEMEAIKTRILTRENVSLASCTDPDDFLSKLDYFIHKSINLRIIHYSGHIEDNQMEIGDGLYLGAGTLSQARNIYFYSRPVVFLNGCSSGQLGYLWDKYDDLATEFLACGAAACIITNFDIIETTARMFSETFYYYFITDHLSVGEALRKTRIQLSHHVKSEDYDPDFDITRYFYNLYGDPTARF